MAPLSEIAVFFEPQPEGGYHVFAPELPGFHTEGASLAEAESNANEALELYFDVARSSGRSLESGVVRRTYRVPA